MNLTKKQRAKLREMFGGRCAYCGCVLGERWHADHVKPILREGKWFPAPESSRNSYVFRQTGILGRPENDHLNNCMPACAPCNIDKGCLTVEDWRKSLACHIRILRDNSSAFRHAERFGMVAVSEEPIVFLFEKEI